MQPKQEEYEKKSDIRLLVVKLTRLFELTFSYDIALPAETNEDLLYNIEVLKEKLMMVKTMIISTTSKADDIQTMGKQIEHVKSLLIEEIRKKYIKK